MNTQKAQKLKELTLKEIELRKKWREAVKTLQDLVQPVTDHNQECCEFWAENFPNALEIAVIMDNDTTYKIVKPKREVAKQEAYLPYGIDYSECEVINVFSEQNGSNDC